MICIVNGYFLILEIAITCCTLFDIGHRSKSYTQIGGYPYQPDGHETLKSRACSKDKTEILLLRWGELNPGLPQQHLPLPDIGYQYCGSSLSFCRTSEIGNEIILNTYLWPSIVGQLKFIWYIWEGMDAWRNLGYANACITLSTRAWCGMVSWKLMCPYGVSTCSTYSTWEWNQWRYGSRNTIRVMC